MFLACPVFFYGYVARRDLHSFPTRRSSDLEARNRPAGNKPDSRRILRRDDSRWAVPGTTVEITGGLSVGRSEEHTSELQSRGHLVCRLLLEKKKHTRTDLHLHPGANLPQDR